MATAPQKPPRLRIERPTVADRRRWSMWKLDKSIEEIAARERVAARFIQASIDKVENFRFLPTSELLVADIHAASIEMLDDWKGTVRDATKARKYRTKANGREQIVVDHDTRLAAAREIREMTALTQPKGGPGVQVNVQNNNGATRPGGGMDFESRVRMIRAKHAGVLPGMVQTQLPAPQEERSHTEMLADDMEGAGLELEDSDLDELEDSQDADEPEGDETEEEDTGDDSDADSVPEASGKELDEEW